MSVYFKSCCTSAVAEWLYLAAVERYCSICGYWILKVLQQVIMNEDSDV